MSIIQAIVLGIIQGLTEFLPISSSAHLLLFPFYFGWKIDATKNIPFYVMVHAGTLFAVLSFFSYEVLQITKGFFKSITERKINDEPYKRLSWLLLLATIPAGVFYLLFDKLLSNALETPLYVGIFLLITGLLLTISEKISSKNTESKNIKTLDAIFIGIMQGIALLPGISRSGSTIAGGLFRGLTREEAARFSFLLSIPVIVVGTLEEAKELAIGAQDANLVVLAVGFFSALITGYLAIKYFLEYIKKHSLYVFAIYCFALGLITISVSTLK